MSKFSFKETQYGQKIDKQKVYKQFWVITHLCWSPQIDFKQSISWLTLEIISQEVHFDLKY